MRPNSLTMGTDEVRRLMKPAAMMLRAIITGRAMWLTVLTTTMTGLVPLVNSSSILLWNCTA